LPTYSGMDSPIFSSNATRHFKRRWYGTARRARNARRPEAGNWKPETAGALKALTPAQSRRQNGGAVSRHHFSRKGRTRVKRPPAPGPHATPAVADLLASDFARRKFDRELRVCEAAPRVLCFCRYRRAPEHLSYVRPAAHNDALGVRRGPSSCFVLDLAAPMRWYEEVYARGLACASGCFVFAVMEGGGGRRARRTRREAGEGLHAAARPCPRAARARRVGAGLAWAPRFVFGTARAASRRGRRLLRPGAAGQDWAECGRHAQSPSSGLLTPRPPRFRTWV
jgi:hypothetical protein